MVRAIFLKFDNNEKEKYDNLKELYKNEKGLKRLSWEDFFRGLIAIMEENYEKWQTKIEP